MGKFADLNGEGYVILIEFDPNIHKYLLYYLYVFLNEILNIEKINPIK